MPGNVKDFGLVERQLRRLVAAITEKAESDPDFAGQLARILNLSGGRQESETDKPRDATFNPVDILHREGAEALQRQLDLRTDAELKEILRQQGLRRQRGEKQFDRGEAIQAIKASAERRLHQGSAFLQVGE